MICADLLAGAHLDNGNSDVLLQFITRFFKLLPEEQSHRLLAHANQNA
jgi:hypothetical protein